jgi:carbamoyltransferase
MIVLGINSGTTKAGRLLNDGGACLVIDGKIVAAIQEERLNRQKYSGGFEKAIEYVCDVAKIGFSSIDKVVVSSCIDSKWTVKEAVKILELKKKFGFSEDKVEVVGHHLSHAYCGFISSGFKRALVCVADNTGNKLTKDIGLWNGGFERTSYYQAEWKNSKPSIELIETDASKKEEIGYGEAFRYFTHYFGWDSYKDAGKTMGLAAYGSKDLIDAKLFKRVGNKEVCLLGSKHDSPIIELKKYFLEQGIKLLKEPNCVNEPIQYYADLALFLQTEFEKSIIRRLSGLKKQTKNKVWFC